MNARDQNPKASAYLLAILLGILIGTPIGLAIRALVLP